MIDPSVIAVVADGMNTEHGNKTRGRIMVENPVLSWACLSLVVSAGLAIMFFLPPPKNLWTVEHDGHKWIQWNSGLNVQTIHHPDCCCGGKR